MLISFQARAMSSSIAEVKNNPAIYKTLIQALIPAIGKAEVLYSTPHKVNVKLFSFAYNS